jgi:hypothetical protein
MEKFGEGKIMYKKYGKIIKKGDGKTPSPF